MPTTRHYAIWCEFARQRRKIDFGIAIDWANSCCVTEVDHIAEQITKLEQAIEEAVWRRRGTRALSRALYGS
jgi:hypothetical protein